MNTYKIQDITTTADIEGRMVQLKFTMLALNPGGTPAESTRIENFNPPGDMVSSFTDEDLVKLCESISVSVGLHTFLDQVLVRLSTPPSVALAPLVPPEVIGTSEGQYPAIWAVQIDNSVATVYARFSRFQIEYAEKEAAAKNYADAGYIGEPEAWVKDYATSAGLSYKEAADAILLEAHKWHDAIPKLGALRVQKYLILNAENLQTARDAFERIKQAIQSISEGL